MDKSVDLIEIMRNQFAVSKQWLRYSIWCNVIVISLAIIDSSNVLGMKYSIISVATLVLQMAAFILRQISSHNFSFAEEVRRLALFQDGLGIKIQELHIKRIVARVREPKIKEPSYIGTYYESLLEPGPERLLKIISESCFYTLHIAKHAFKIIASVAISCFVGLVVLLLIFISITINYSTLTIFTRLSVAFLAFWATGDVVIMAVKFWNLQKKCSSILDKCEELEEIKNYGLTEIMILIDEYNCVLSASIPLPSKYYEAKKAKLNECWSGRSVD
jgi:hypothetical protein